MRREMRHPTKKELREITSRRPVVRRIPAAGDPPHNTSERLSGSSRTAPPSDRSGATESKRVRPFARSLTIARDVTDNDERGAR